MTYAALVLLGAVAALWQEIRRRSAVSRAEAADRATTAALDALRASTDTTARLESLITARDAEIVRAWSAADACAAADPAAALDLLRRELDPAGARSVPPG